MTDLASIQNDLWAKRKARLAQQHTARIIMNGSTMATIRDADEDKAFERADRMMTLMGWHTARIVINA